MKTSILYELLIAMILGFIGKINCFISDQETNAVTLQHSMVTCSTNMACKYVICLWERNPTISPEKCAFLDNHCSCPSNKICAMSDYVTPGSTILSFQYRCKNPADLFDNRIQRSASATRKSRRSSLIPFIKRK